MYVVKKPKNCTFTRAGVRGTIFPTAGLTSKTQFLVIETETGHETRIKEKECDFSYYVLEGKGYFMVDGKKEKCGIGDLIVVPAGKTFTYQGKLRMLLNVTPVFRPEQEEVVR
jgi:mannose-6-phosphate isomerase-like protein (cupin superfamily)